MTRQLIHSKETKLLPVKRSIDGRLRSRPVLTPYLRVGFHLKPRRLHGPSLGKPPALTSFSNQACTYGCHPLDRTPPSWAPQCEDKIRTLSSTGRVQPMQFCKDVLDPRSLSRTPSHQHFLRSEDPAGQHQYLLSGSNNTSETEPRPGRVATIPLSGKTADISLAVPSTWTAVRRQCFVFIARSTSPLGTLQRGLNLLRRARKLAYVFSRSGLYAIDESFISSLPEMPLVEEIQDSHALLTSALIIVAVYVLVSPSSRPAFQGPIRNILINMAKHSAVDLVLVGNDLDGITAQSKKDIPKLLIAEVDVPLHWAFPLFMSHVT